MPHVTLIAKPGDLPSAVVEDVFAQGQGTGLTWLALGEAAQFQIPEEHAQTVRKSWQALQSQKIDLVVHPLSGTAKKLLIADMDSTMIEQECIDELADEAGCGPQVAEITARAMNGELDFEAALDARVSLLRGVTPDTIARVIADRITLAGGAATTLTTMRANGARCVLVSGGFTVFTRHIAEVLNFDEHHANELLVDPDGTLSGAVALPILGRESKLQILQDLLARHALDHAQSIAVGDGMNDLSMLRAAGIGVSLHGKPALQKAVEARINHGDLTALLFLQGYKRSDFVTL